MTVAVPPLHTPALESPEVAALWARHLLSLYLPLNSLLFLWTGPHPWWVAILFMAPLVLAQQLDSAGFEDRRQPPAGLPAWPFDALVYALAALQFLVVWELVSLFRVQNLFSFDMLMVFLVVGSASGFSIVTAHELIHRRRRWEQRLGRLLLCTVLYEHFYTEHIRGHHARVGTPEDPATARFGEAYEPFFRRTVPAQLRSAWRLEKQRLGDVEMGLLDSRMLHNRVLHGLILEWGLAGGIWASFGFVPFFAFVLQAFAAVRLLEAVNYFEHWGIVRQDRVVKPEHSWDTHSKFTYYALIGLTRHADHHARASRPYQRLRVHEDAPVLPVGYVALVDMVMGRNADFQRIATEELARRRLGPFAAPEGAAALPVSESEAQARLESAQAAGRRAARAPGPLRRRWRRLPVGVRWTLALAGIVVGTALGAHWETGGAAMGFVARVLFHAGILGAFVVALSTRQRIEPHTGEPLSWVVAFAILLAVGGVSAALF